jgi:hypothetical protein
MGTPRRRGLPLAERTGAARVLRAPQPAPRPSSARHCWVQDPPGYPGRWPGLLQYWERTPISWRGRVTFAVVTPDGHDAVIETWLDGTYLKRA